MRLSVSYYSTFLFALEKIYRSIICGFNQIGGGLMNFATNIPAGIIYCFIVTCLLQAQTSDLKLVNWKPVSQMVVNETKIIKAKYPVPWQIYSPENHLAASFPHSPLNTDSEGLLGPMSGGIFTIKWAAILSPFFLCW